ncbi:MAG: hypothetical protein JRH15_16135, partial [Deltaproteobacteria bacterium]|nr:hypothetical protein [Deltaproteobacteria bacterium]
MTDHQTGISNGVVNISQTEFVNNVVALPIRFFDRVVLKWPGVVIFVVMATVALLGYYVKDFRLDASAETLVLEHDKDLKYARLIASRYGMKDSLVLAYTPREDLFSEAALTRIARLQADLAALPGVSSVFCILNAPLLQSPPVNIEDLLSNIRTLSSPDIDKSLAREELRKSPLFRDLLVSRDLKTTALIVYLPTDVVYDDLRTRRNEFREKAAAGGLSPAEAAEYEFVQKKFQMHHDNMRRARHRNLA